MSRSIGLALISLLFLPAPTLAQTAQLSSAEMIEKVSPAVAVVIAGKLPTQADTFGSAILVRENGILLTPYHIIKDAKAVQIRFKSGEVFDEVQLLGVDTRRDVAALRITASGLPTLPIASASKAKAGDSVFIISKPSAKAWSADPGTVNAYRLSDGVPGAGTGFRVLQFTAPAFGASDGLVVDDQGRALALIVRANNGEMHYSIPLENVLGLTEVPVKFSYLSGVALQPPGSLQPPPDKPIAARVESLVMPTAHAEKTVLPQDPIAPSGQLSEDLIHSEILKSKDPDFILRNFRTMYVDAKNAKFFDSARMSAALGSHDGFKALHISLVNDQMLADVILEVSYTFAWDYPFLLRHQVTSIVLVSGKGYGPFSGPRGAESVAGRLIDQLKPYRVAPVPKKESKPKTDE